MFQGTKPSPQMASGLRLWVIYFYLQSLPLWYLNGTRGLKHSWEIHTASTGTLVWKTCTLRTCSSLSLPNMPPHALLPPRCPKQLLVSTFLFPMILPEGPGPSIPLGRDSWWVRGCSPEFILGPTGCKKASEWAGCPPGACGFPLDSSHCRKGLQQCQVPLMTVEVEEEWCLLFAVGGTGPWLEELGCLSDYLVVPGALGVAEDPWGGL